MLWVNPYKTINHFKVCKLHNSIINFFGNTDDNLKTKRENYSCHRSCAFNQLIRACVLFRKTVFRKSAHIKLTDSTKILLVTRCQFSRELVYFCVPRIRKRLANWFENKIKNQAEKSTSKVSLDDLFTLIRVRFFFFNSREKEYFYLLKWLFIRVGDLDY